MAWIRRNLRGTKVYARTRADGKSLDVDAGGRVDVKYQLDEGAKIYRASARNLEEPAAVEGESANVPLVDVETRPTAHDPAAIVIYTDGACTGNPGPMGIGAVLMMDGKRVEISEFLGHGTNNIAELTAIERALDAVPVSERARPVLVHSDSGYSIGLLASGWKAKANQELVERIRKKTRLFPKIRFVKVAGHAGVPENERCDELARAGVLKRS